MKKKIAPETPRRLGYHIEDKRMDEGRGTLTLFNYFLDQNTGLRLRIMQLHPMASDLVELAEQDMRQQGEDPQKLHDLMDRHSWSLTLVGFFGLNAAGRQEQRMHSTRDKSHAVSVASRTLLWLQNPQLNAQTILFKEHEAADEDEDEPAYTLIYSLTHRADNTVTFAFSLVADDGDTEYHSVDLETTVVQRLFQDLLHRLEPDGHT